MKNERQNLTHEDIKDAALMSKEAYNNIQTTPQALKEKGWKFKGNVDTIIGIPNLTLEMGLAHTVKDIRIDYRADVYLN